MYYWDLLFFFQIKKRIKGVLISPDSWGGGGGGQGYCAQLEKGLKIEGGASGKFLQPPKAGRGDGPALTALGDSPEPPLPSH